MMRARGCNLEYRSAALLAALLAVGQTAAAHGQIVLTRVLLNGQPLVNTPTTWLLTTHAGISPSGRQFVATGQITAGGTAVAAGNPSEGFRLVASTNAALSPVPGAPPSVTYASFSDAFVDDAGRVLIRAALNGALGPGLFIDVDGTVTGIVRTGDPVPESSEVPPGLTFASVGQGADGVSFANGRAIFLATLGGAGVTTSNDRSMWLFDAADGSLRLVAREGARWQAFGQPLINSAGQIVFYGDLLMEPSNDDGVLVQGAPDAGDIFARESASAPGTATTFLANDFPATQMYAQEGLAHNDRGEAAFRAALNQSPQDGLWRRGPGLGAATFLITRQGAPVAGLGSPAPQMGAPVGVRLGGGIGAAAGGAVAWRTLLTGASVMPSNDGVLFRALGAGTPGSFEAIVREGDAAPGEAAGVTFAAVPTVYALNQSGQMFIKTTIAGGSLPGNTTSFYASDPNAGMGGMLYKLFRSGDTVLVSGVPGLSSGTYSGSGVFDTTVNGPQSGRPSAMSDDGHDTGGLVAVLGTIAPTGGGSSVGGLFTITLAPDLVGACCRGSTCMSVPESQCGSASPAGLFAGAGTSCNVFPSTIAPCCMADFNSSGGAGGGDVTVQDIFDFLSAYFAGDLRTDINGSGALSVQDIFDFLAAYFEGCG